MSIGSGIAVAGMWAGIAAISYIGREQISGVGYAVIVIAAAIATVIGDSR